MTKIIIENPAMKLAEGGLGLRTFAKKSAKGSAAVAQKKGFVSTTTTTRLTSSARAGERQEGARRARVS
jgi:hypothetical protein